MKTTYEIREIDFKTLKDWWVRTDHFNVPDKEYSRTVTELGPFRSIFLNPKVQEYGLFDGKKHIGVTQFQEWDEDTVRWRTINILPEYRGNDIAWWMLSEIWKRDWSDRDYMIGWFVEQYIPWTKKYGFKPIHEDLIDGHIMVRRNMKDYK